MEGSTACTGAVLYEMESSDVGCCNLAHSIDNIIKICNNKLTMIIGINNRKQQGLCSFFHADEGGFIMKVTKTFGVVGLVLCLLFGSVSGLMVVKAADGCSHGSIVETTSAIGTREETHTCYVDGKAKTCTITYTTYQRVAVCGNCGAYLGRWVYEYYTHSVNHD